MKIGILKQNKFGRYEIETGAYVTSGTSVEIFKFNRWIKGRIEYSHKTEDYYFLNDEDKIYIYNLEGVKARFY